MSEVNVNLEVRIDIDCPKCKHDFNLFDLSEFTDDGYIFEQLMPDGGYWGKEKWNKEVSCPKCKENILIKNVTW